MSGKSTPRGAPADIVENIEGVLSVFGEDPGDPQDVLDLLAAGQALRRFPEGEETRQKGEEVMAALETADPETFRAAVELVSPERWIEEYENLATVFEAEIGVTRDPRREADYAVEALRLFRLLDGWRLGMVGLLQRPGLPSDLRRIAEEKLRQVEKGPVDALLGGSDLFADVGPIASEALELFRSDLEELDADLAATADIYAAVAAELRAWPPPAEIRFRREASILPPVLTLAAAESSSPLPRCFVWESPDGTARASLDFIPGTPEEEERRGVTVRLPSAPAKASPWLKSSRIRLFGIEAPVRSGEAVFLKGELRRASEKRPDASLEVLHPERGNWERWKWIAPYEDDAP